jgi:chemotaxis regulatin CheY-phosphate phosphatase CheZ
VEPFKAAGMSTIDDTAAKSLVARIEDLVAQVEQQRKALNQALEEARLLADRVAQHEADSAKKR